MGESLLLSHTSTLAFSSGVHMSIDGYELNCRRERLACVLKRVILLAVVGVHISENGDQIPIHPRPLKTTNVRS